MDAHYGCTRRYRRALNYFQVALDHAKAPRAHTALCAVPYMHTASTHCCQFACTRRYRRALNYFQVALDHAKAESAAAYLNVALAQYMIGTSDRGEQDRELLGRCLSSWQCGGHVGSAVRMGNL